MSSSAVYNLLKGTADGTWAYKSSQNSIDPAPAFGTAVVSCVMPSGVTYYQEIDRHVGIGIIPRKGDSVTLSFWCKASAECEIHSFIYGDGTTIASALKHDENGKKTTDGDTATNVSTDWTYVRHTWTYDADATKSPSFIVTRLMNDVPVGTVVSIAGVMLVEGDTPAAWAPAEGETLAGGGALMSANLLNGLAPTLLSGTTESEGTYHHAARTEADGHKDWLMWDLPDQAALETNQTYHVGLSVRGASANAASLHMTIGYEDAAGKRNWVESPALAIGTSWGRVEGALVVPSGMRPFALYVAAYGVCPETWMANPTLSLGSPVTLASSAHTPYATQDHVAAEYATKAALKVTSDAVTAEVTERGKLAGRVGTLESTSGTHASKLEQLATSIKSLVKGESTYTDPDGTSVTSGIYSLVTQTRDSVTALFGSYTKTEDLASTQAVKDAKKAGTDAASAASAAQSTADRAQSTADAALDNAGTANEKVGAVEARVSASIDGLDVRVRGVSEAVSAQGATVRDVERNMSFGLDGLVIGAADSASKVRITDKRETFEVDGKTVLALDGDTSTVEASALKIGGYVWTATNGGKNLTLVYRG